MSKNCVSTHTSTENEHNELSIKKHRTDDSFEMWIMYICTTAR